MRPWEYRSFNVASVIVAVTGFVYLYMKFFMQTDDPFAIVNHPWQSSMLSMHVIAAPFLVLLFGVLFRSHTIEKIMSGVRTNRRTGWTSLLSFSSMALSGYFLQVVTSPTWIDALILIHIATSVVFVVGYMIHLVLGSRIFLSASGTARQVEGPVGLPS